MSDVAFNMLLYLAATLLVLVILLAAIHLQERRRSTKEVWYVAHPVSGDVKGNIQNVIRWIHWLTLNDPSRVYIAPWVAEVQAFDKDIGGAEPDAAFYDRVLADDCDVVRHLDGVLMVGGKTSRGMALERDAALAAGKQVVDLSHLRNPPPPASEMDDYVRTMLRP